MLYFQNRFPTRLALIWRLARFILIRCLVDLNPHRFYKVCKVQALECNCQEMWPEDFHIFCCKSYEAHVKKLSEKKHVFVDTMHVQHVIDESLYHALLWIVEYLNNVVLISSNFPSHTAVRCCSYISPQYSSYITLM